jgi:AcrR family transcriptional regulator
VPARKRTDPLSAEAVIEAGLAVTRRDGLSALTMRAVAAELQVTPMAIYYHVADKEQLVRAVVKEVTRHQVPLEQSEDGWQLGLRHYLLSGWEVMTRYPGISAHLLALPTFGTTTAGLETGIRFFKEAGFSDRSARKAWTFTHTYLHGRLNVDSHLHGPSGDPVRFIGVHSREHVEFAIDAMVAGLEALLVAEQNAEKAPRRRPRSSVPHRAGKVPT